MTADTDTFAGRKGRLAGQLTGGRGEIGIRKRTSSNLFRYAPRARAGRTLDLGAFDHVLGLDPQSRTLEAEGLATFEAIVDRALPHGLVPLITPELKHITVGGATVGIGIESTCYRHGFVHDGLREADVLLPGGTVVTARADNQHADLFNALPNSYGTLGYILRAKIALHRAGPYVQVHVEKFRDAAEYLEAMRVATESPDLTFVEGLFFEDKRFFLITGRFVDQVPWRDDIVRNHVFYRLVEKRRDIYLTTFDYIFRYDPDWFWNVPETGFYNLFRRYAPEQWRNSAFYTKYVALKAKVLGGLGMRDERTEPLIQDWEVPWRHGEELIRFAIDNVDLAGRPWAAVPIKTPRQPTLYPIKPNELYFNLGCYCQVQRPPGMEPYHYTKILDRKCFELEGIKMLYSSTFLGEAEFDALFNGAAYRQLKAKYDVGGNALTLYKKVAFAQR